MEKYIGIPFKTHGRAFSGADCWGVITLWYFHEYGIRLSPLLNYSDTEDVNAIETIIYNEKMWWEKTENPEQGDVVVLKIAGKPTHVGVYLDGHRMLHAFQGIDSCTQSLSDIRWKNRIEGFYTYE